jgi:hypothetical protein
LVVSARSAVVFALHVLPVFGCPLVCRLVLRVPLFRGLRRLAGCALVSRCCFSCWSAQNLTG